MTTPERKAELMQLIPQDYYDQEPQSASRILHVICAIDEALGKAEEAEALQGEVEFALSVLLGSAMKMNVDPFSSQVASFCWEIRDRLIHAIKISLRKSRGPFSEN